MISVTVKASKGLKFLTTPWRDLIAEPQRELLTTAIGYALTNVQKLAGPRHRSAFKSDVLATTAAVRSNLGPALSNVLEVGRTPGATGPPPEAVMRYAFDPQDTFAISRAISERGSKGRFFRKRTIEGLERSIPGWLKKMGHKIEVEFDRK